jgi:hypothetical protein
MPISSAQLYYRVGAFASASRVIFGAGLPLRGRVVLSVAIGRRLLSPRRFAAASGAFGQQFADDHEIVGEHRGADKQREALSAFGAATLHAAAAHQHGNAPLDAGAEALALLECGRSFVSLALRRLAAATLRNARHRDATARADGEIVLAEEAAVGAIEGWGTAEDAAVTPQRGRHMDFVHRVALERLILSDQAPGAFREKHFVAKFDGRAHFATLDEIGMRLEDRVDLLRCGHLFAIEHAPARLADHPCAEIAIVRDLLAQGFDVQGGERVLAAHRGRIVKRLPGARHYLLGNLDQRPVGRGLLRSGALTLPRRHALNLIHAPMRSTRTIAKTRDARQFQRLRKPAEEPREHAHHVPQQGVVGRMMNVGLHHRGVDPQFPAVLKAQLHGGFDEEFIDGLERRWRQPVEAAVEGVMLAALQNALGLCADTSSAWSTSRRRLGRPGQDRSGMVNKFLLSFSFSLLQRQLHTVHRPRLRAEPSSKETEVSTTQHLAGLSGFLTLIQSRDGPDR